MPRKQIKVELTFLLILALFSVLLVAPLMKLLAVSLQSGSGLDFSRYAAVLGDKSVTQAIRNSLQVSAIAALATTVLAFILAYAIQFTRIPSRIKSLIRLGIVAPMLLPTITYGFAILYSFGKQGLLTKLLGRELLQIYGVQGLLLGYIVYTLPFAFLLLNNSFLYIDKKYLIVSVLMGDGTWRRFLNTVLRPLIGSIGGAYAVAFILSFTDFGIPASIGGHYNVVATELYQVMLGSIPDFESGSVIAILMLAPAIAGILLLNYLERFNFYYDAISATELPKNKLRDFLFAVFSLGVAASIAALFLVMFLAPFVKNYPYDLTFSLQFVRNALFTDSIRRVYGNSILVAVASAALGTLLAYVSALLQVRTALAPKAKLCIDVFALTANTAPGMVLGLSYLMLFNDSHFKGTFLILILCNIIHFYTTPYLMAKNSLAKLNPAWETTGALMGDTWIKTILRVIVPNSTAPIVEMFGYFFINSMVTISAIIFLVTAQTAVITSKIKELQHFASFNEIFVLSLLIFFTNLLVQIGCATARKKLSSASG